MLKICKKLQEKRFVFVKILAIIIPENGAKVSKIKCLRFNQQTLFILQTAIGMTGLVWAQPVADVLSILIAAILFEKTMKKMQMLYYHMLRIYLFQF